MDPINEMNVSWDTPISVAEAAAIARVSPRTLHRWIKRGLIKGYGAGRSPRVTMAEVLPPRPVRTRGVAR